MTGAYGGGVRRRAGPANHLPSLSRRPVLAAGLTLGAAALRGAPILAQALPSVPGRVVAVGIPGAGAICQVGVFLPGGPIHDRPEFAPYTAAGRVLEPR